MSRTAAKNTQADIARALRAAHRLGMTIEIMPNGVIRVVPIDYTQENNKTKINVATPVQSLF